MSSAPLFDLGPVEARPTLDVEPRPEEKHTRSFRLPYQLGLYLAVNAIPDAYAVIDGPDCLYRKAEWVHGKHDLRSTLLDVFGEHRIVSTLLYSSHVIKSDGSEVRARIERVARIRGAGAILVCSMPHVMIIGTQYDRILAELDGAVSLPMLEVPSRSLSGDWLDGYDETLLAIARHLALPSIDPDPARVAIVGHLMDRNEADQLANSAELRRLIEEGLGLEVCSVWLEGRRFAELAEVQRAGLVVALPHARRAAHAVAGRTGAKVVDAPLPIGLRQTRAFLRRVGDAADRRDRTEAFIEREQASLVPRAEWAVPHYFAGRRVAFVGDPYHFEGFVSLAEEVGVTVPLLAATARKPVDFALAPSDFEPPSVAFSPTFGTLERLMRELMESDPVDLVVGTSTAMLTLPEGARPATLELGFPCFGRHAIFDSPYLGFRGWAWLLEAMMGALNARERHGGP